MPLVTVLRPCGNDTRPLDQTIVGVGKPKAWQETEVSEFAVTFITLSGVLMNCGGTEMITKQKQNKTSKKKYQTRHFSQRPICCAGVQLSKAKGRGGSLVLTPSS